MSHDPVNHPRHYTSSKAQCSSCGARIECIDIAKHCDFVIGNVIKYAWRAGNKEGTTRLRDLEKMAWYANLAVEEERKQAKQL